MYKQVDKDLLEDLDTYVEDLSDQIIHTCPKCGANTQFVDTTYKGKYVKHHICTMYHCGAEFYTKGW